MQVFELVIAGKAIDAAASFFTAQFGGVTVTPSSGQWIDDTGKNHVEPSARILVCIDPAQMERDKAIKAHAIPSYVRSAVSAICAQNGEQCALVIHENRGEFVHAA